MSTHNQLWFEAVGGHLIPERSVLLIRNERDPLGSGTRLVATLVNGRRLTIKPGTVAIQRQTEEVVR